MNALLSLFTWLEALDRSAFRVVNGQWTHPLLDRVLPLMREPIVWVPLYTFIVLFALVNFGKKGAAWVFCLVFCVSLADFIGARIFKEGIERLRPCVDPEMVAVGVRLLLKRCSGAYSFVSNHAATHVSIATLISITGRPLFGRWSSLGFLWAALICWAQMYVGVHYPLDILGGAGLGVLCGWAVSHLFHRKWGSFTLA